MSKLFITFTLVLFLLIGFAALRKNKGERSLVTEGTVTAPIELEMDIEELSKPAPVLVSFVPEPTAPQSPIDEGESLPRSSEGLPYADRMTELFTPGDPRLPIVETITYKSRVPWLKGRPAWVSDYASHYETSRHFIARSLNGKQDYFKQDVAEGDRFNVLRSDIEIRFHLVIDVSRAKMWFYAHDVEADKRYLLKNYDVELGRLEPSKASGLLTPLGTYTLGSKIAIYKPSSTGFYQGEKTEMIKIFGTRWIPFEKEVANTTAPAKGLGIHGVQWLKDPKTTNLVEQRDSVKKYDSDGCIRLLTEDIEELYAIIITKPTTVELVSDFHEAKLPGKEEI